MAKPIDTEDKQIRGMTKCPGCEVEILEDDLRAQKAHMEQYHPDIIQRRLRQ